MKKVSTKDFRQRSSTSLISDQSSFEFNDLNKVCPFITDEMYAHLLSLVKIPPFNSPNIIEHMIENYEEWNEFYSASTHGSSIAEIPGPYASRDVDAVNAEQQILEND